MRSAGVARGLSSCQYELLLAQSDLRSEIIAAFEKLVFIISWTTAKIRLMADVDADTEKKDSSSIHECP